MTAEKKRKGSAHKRPTKNPASNKSRARKNASKGSNKLTSKSNAYGMVPPEIRPLVNDRRNLLPSEDPKLYDSLFVLLASRFRPTDALQWLDVKKLQNLCWEQMRLSRIKPGVIQSAQMAGLISFFESVPGGDKTEYTQGGLITQAKLQALQWYTNPGEREKLENLLTLLHCSEDTIDAMAFLERMDELTTIDTMQMSNEVQQVSIRNRLEEARHVLELQAEPENNDAPVQPQLEHHEDAEQSDAEAGDIEPPTDDGDATDAESDDSSNDLETEDVEPEADEAEADADSDTEAQVEADEDETESEEVDDHEDQDCA